MLTAEEDGEARAATFLPDGVFEGTVGRFEGRAAIAAHTNEGRKNPHPNRWGAMPGELQHWVFNYVIDGAGDEATARSYIGLVRATGEVLLVGRYTDRVRKIEGRWLFAHRHFEPLPVQETADAGRRGEPHSH